jgi:hypothetical protein
MPSSGVAQVVVTPVKDIANTRRVYQIRYLHCYCYDWVTAIVIRFYYWNIQSINNVTITKTNVLLSHTLTDTNVLLPHTLTDTNVLLPHTLTDTNVLLSHTLTDTNVLLSHTLTWFWLSF